MPGVGLGVLLIALAYAAAFARLSGSVTAWLMLTGISVLLCSLCLLGAGRHRASASLPFRAGVALLGLVLLGGVGAALLLPPDAPGQALLLGLPRRAALVVYGIGVLPALFVPLVYALSFDSVVLTEQELQELRTRLASLEPEGKDG